jgi:hypothetical protein
MITLRADPRHPHGGYAELGLPADRIEADTVELAVFDKYSERYLGGDGWQATREAFGPYEVVRDGATARVVIGPEVVNQIEEYANLRLECGGLTQDVAWPDDIVPAPGAARIGGILSARAASGGGEPGLAVRLQGPVPDDTATDPAPPEPAPPEPDPEPPQEPQEATDPGPGAEAGQDTARRPGGLWLWLLALVLAGLGGAWWYLQERPFDPPAPVAETDRPAQPEPEPEVQAEAAPEADPCALATIAAQDGFAAQLASLRGCGADTSADTALTVLERAAGGGDADALLLFGEIYDSEAGDPVIEETIGLSLPDSPATAAEYYGRAVEAGSDEARARLEALCSRLGGMSDTLARSAFADHCES